MPTAAPSLAAWLALDNASSAPRISTEQFLIEVLQSQCGFALMMQHILEVLIKAEARRGGIELSVEFKFDAVTDPIKATLQQFREIVQHTQYILEKRPELPNCMVMNEISSLLRKLLTTPLKYRSGHFPRVSAISPTGYSEVDAYLEILSSLVSDFRELWRSHGATRKELKNVADNKKKTDSESQVLIGQLYAATDFWDIQVLAGAQELSRQTVSGQLPMRNALEILQAVVSKLEWGAFWVEHTFQELLDLLTLPAWRRRHELYSVWVGTRILDVVERNAQEMYFHTVNGVLSFEFGGSRLASFNQDNRQLDVWAELRSGLVGKSAKRKKGIQPDFRVLKTDLSKSINAQTIYIVECKHYLNSNTSNFTQAGVDYARSCPNSAVHIVNHGPAQESRLTAALPIELQTKVGFIGEATPQLEAVSGVLGNAIRRALFPNPEPTFPSAVASAPCTEIDRPVLGADLTGCVYLEWDKSLEDMDLALRVIGSDGQITESVDFRTRGALDVPPFALFDNDVRKGPGEEHIDVRIWYFNRYELIATNYSKSGQMSPEGLRCRIVTPLGETILKYAAGSAPTKHEWKIADLHATDGVVTIVQYR